MADMVEYEATPYWFGTPSVDTAESLTASALDIPVKPPGTWFSDPGLTALTPLTVDNTGRVFGHIASWAGSHIGRLGKIKPPRSKSGYQYFRTGTVETDEGTMVPVGQITLVGGHAPLKASAQDAVAHYDNTQSAVMDVSVGEDSHGIWVAGALRPTVDDVQMRTIRASSVSGDWRPIDNSLELVAICSVNVPGFPIPRALAASLEDDDADEVMVYALVAAGAEAVATLAHPDEMIEGVRRVIDDVEMKMDWVQSIIAAIGQGAGEDDVEVYDEDDDAEDDEYDEEDDEEFVDDDDDAEDDVDDDTADLDEEDDEDEESSDPRQTALLEADGVTPAVVYLNHLDRETLAAEILAAGDAGTLWTDSLPLHFSCDQVDAVSLRLRAKGASGVDAASRRAAMVAGAAMPDGRLPILTRDDLRKAVLLAPEGSEYHAHLVRRAGALGMRLDDVRQEALTAAVESLTAASEKYDTEARRKMAKSGSAMSEGEFPIKDADDLKNAIQALGRAKDKAAAKAHIMKRARALKLVFLLPEKWSD